ncbi:MAG: HigA family addiction module antidote protein [Verrucomicrobia bacterium]|jgi:addiction module HigA family antidote|nr:HigA family addiction module antidote protein [Verrucomicrobiota bacterium]|tara:strand:- start:19183 stop:19473 length:291 start_codon:yes stop_codon:yes gene_type:complete
MKTSNPLNPAVELLKDELAARNLTKAAAAAMRIPPTRLSEITTRKKRISLDTALRLERFFGIEAEFWLRLQQSHELRLAKVAKSAELEMIQSVAVS